MAGRLLCRGPHKGQRGEVIASTPANPDREINPDRPSCTQGDDASLGTNRRRIAVGHAQHNRPHRRSPYQHASVQTGGELSPPLHRARVGGAEQLQQVEKLGPGLGVVLDHLEQGTKTLLDAVIPGIGDP